MEALIKDLAYKVSIGVLTKEEAEKIIAARRHQECETCFYYDKDIQRPFCSLYGDLPYHPNGKDCIDYCC